MNYSEETRYLVTFANCVPVKGAKRATICDLQRGRYCHIPNSLVEIIQISKTKPLNKVFNEVISDEHEVLNEYIDFMLDNDFGFLDDEPNVFSELDTTWDFPASITNAIIDIRRHSLELVNHQKAINELSDLNCSCVELRFFDKIDDFELNKLLDITLNTRIKEVRLILEFDSVLDKIVKETLIKNHKRISQILFYNSLENLIQKHWGVRFTYLKEKELDATKCGRICGSTFTVNVINFTESLNFNSCLNRKISVDDMGYIKNCPSQARNFGNINDKTFTSVLKEEEYKKLWKIKKDDIKICQNCEYRYICTDCRVFRQDEDDIYSKPKKCNYNPFTCTWE